MPPREPPPLWGTGHFRVVIGRREVGFAEVSRLTSAAEPPDESPRRLETVVLRRALSESSELFDWRRKVAGGRDDRRTVTIQLLASAGGEPVVSWRLEGARPVRWSGPALDAAGNEVAMEELELAYDELVWLEPEQSKGA